MKKIIMCLCLITNLTYGQSTQESDILMTSLYEELINEHGSMIQFEYLFENDAHQMDQPINGNLGLFSDNRFYLEFHPSEKNKVIQIYNGEALFTILTEEKEIQIDNIDQSQGIFIQDILNNYQTDFDSSIKEEQANHTIIELAPKIKYNNIVFNQCIEKLELPKCLKLPNQCKIGILPKNKEKLEMCLKKNGGYQENNILKIELAINTNDLLLESITQLNRYNGKSSIQIKNIKKGDVRILNIENSAYKNFEIIDLR